ncbi:uncharacterized protein BDZ83DRAFT_727622 [Colletotrichum acutatum]|uniref:Uncharacterized protein n=1 Tax=Glomerella acutata TaxID=27357 RepID=A0AAD8XK85_GLOAC|nr:uncharacterized protein BDZ83DRAFT_727622 [Colletotrichum acutatum]KAK1728895.1 hypothetical protein BDZ83DRAFT_727622 [Colletotrichum acutatum]
MAASATPGSAWYVLSFVPLRILAFGCRVMHVRCITEYVRMVWTRILEVLIRRLGNRYPFSPLPFVVLIAKHARLHQGQLVVGKLMRRRLAKTCKDSGGLRTRAREVVWR